MRELRVGEVDDAPLGVVEPVQADVAHDTDHLVPQRRPVGLEDVERHAATHGVLAGPHLLGEQSAHDDTSWLIARVRREKRAAGQHGDAERVEVPAGRDPEFRERRLTRLGARLALELEPRVRDGPVHGCVPCTTGGDDGGRGLQRLHETPVELGSLLALWIPILRDMDLGEDEVRLVEPGVDGEHGAEAPGQQTGPDHEDDRRRDLGHDESLAQPAQPVPAHLTAPGAAQHAHGVASRRIQRRNGAKQDARDDRRECAEREDRRVEGRRRDTWQIVRRERDEEPEPAPPDDDAERPRDERHDRALGEELSGEPAASGAQRRTDPELGPPPRRAGEEEVRHVRAREKQQERDGAEHHDQREPHVADRLAL